MRPMVFAVPVRLAFYHLGLAARTAAAGTPTVFHRYASRCRFRLSRYRLLGLEGSLRNGVPWYCCSINDYVMCFCLEVLSSRSGDQCEIVSDSARVHTEVVAVVPRYAYVSTWRDQGSRKFPFVTVSLYHTRVWRLAVWLEPRLGALRWSYVFPPNSM